MVIFSLNLFNQISVRQYTFGFSWTIGIDAFNKPALIKEIISIFLFPLMPSLAQIISG